MYEIKKQIYLNFTKNQKAALCSFLRALVKKSPELSADEVFDKFIEDETYYYNQGAPHFEWIIDEFEKDEFQKQLVIYIVECKKQLELKDAQKPLIEKQKALMKEQRKRARDFKLSKEPPTKKQLYYYDKLCKKYKIEKENTDSSSRLELMKMIERIVNEHKDTEIIPEKPAE